MDKRHRLAVAGLFAVLIIVQPALPGNDFAAAKMYYGQEISSNPKMSSRPLSRSQGIYAPELDHIWNRLHRHLYTRSAQNGQEYGYDGLDPLLWYQTKYLLDGKSYHQAIALLDEFLSTDAEKSIAEPLKRAMLQRDLWSVFDWLSASKDDHQTQRRELQLRLAQIIKRLALTRDQIEALPDNYALAVASKLFPTGHQPDQGKAPFLPPDIFAPDGPWVCISNNRGGPVAQSHARFFNGRSTFLVFVRLPGGREATLAYLKVLRDFSQPWIVNTNRSLEPDPVLPNPDLPQFPVGTQLALVRQLALIDAQGDLTPTHLTESIQLRVYRAVPKGTEINGAEARASQDVYKFILSRSRLFANVTGGLRSVEQDEKEFPLFMSQGIDGLEISKDSSTAEKFQSSVLSSCSTCHASPGVHSMLSYSRRRLPAQSIFPPELKISSPSDESSNTAYWKVTQYDWGLLQGLWQSNDGKGSALNHR